MAGLKEKIVTFFERMSSLYGFYKFIFWGTWLNVLVMVVSICVMQVLYNWHLWYFLTVLSVTLFGGSVASAFFSIFFIYCKLYVLDEERGNSHE